MVKVGKWIAKHRILMLIIGVLLTKTSHTPNGLRTLKIQYFS